VSQAHEDLDQGSFPQLWTGKGLAATLSDAMRADGAGTRGWREREDSLWKVNNIEFGLKSIVLWLGAMNEEGGSV
jgi:hypothetical protein